VRLASRAGWGVLVLGVVLGTLISGCVSVPTTGPVRSVERVATVDEAPLNRPAEPALNAPPTQIVFGFLDAMEAYPVSTEVAAEYLTAEAAQRWRPGRGTVVYDERTTESLPTTGGRRSSIALEVNEVVRLSARGTYRPAAARGEVERQPFSLIRVDGQWRIADPPDALYVRTTFFERYYDPFDLYFLDRTQQALVSDLVFLPIGAQLPTQLVRGVLAGPTRWLGGQAVTTVPSSARVAVSVPLRSDGVAEVQLSASVAELPAVQLRLLSAQLAWTLRQVPAVSAFRITVDGTALDVGADDPQAVDAFAEYDPSGPATRSQLYALTRRGALTIAGDENPYPGLWGGRVNRMTDFSITLTDVPRVAAVRPARSRLRVGPLGAKDFTEIDTWYTAAGALIDPQWDRTGQLWVLDRTSTETSWVVTDDRDAEQFPAGRLGSAATVGMAISPDGTRVAALVDEWEGPVWGGAAVDGPAVVIARVRRDKDGTVRRLDRAYAAPSPGVRFTTMRDVDWGAPSYVSVLADSAQDRAQPYELTIDGSQLLGGAVSGNDLAGARTIASAGVSGAVTVVGTKDGRLLMEGADDGWAALADGQRRPHYHS